MQVYSNIETVYQATFPASQAGKLSFVYYKVDRLDQTGAPTSYIVRNQYGVIESGNGAYAVNLVLGEGRYNIAWDIESTPYVANEEINVIQNIYDVIQQQQQLWTGYGAGQRQGVRVSIPINLQFNLLRNGQFYNAYRAIRVETYSSYDDAVNGVNLVETITDITHPSLGLYIYQSQAFSVVGTKFDKIFFELEQGFNEYYFINPFYIREASYTPPSTGEYQTVRVYLNVSDLLGIVKKNQKVEVCMNAPHAWYYENFITQNTKVFSTLEDGSVYMDLIPTDILTSSTYAETGDERTIQYKVNVCGKFDCIIEVPSNIIQAHFKDLIV